MTPLLACTDGSHYDSSVCDHAAWAAERLKLPIHILHMLDPKSLEVAQSSLCGGLTLKSADLDEVTQVQAAKTKLAHKQGKTILADARSRLTYLGVKQVSTMLENGRLSDYVKSRQQDVGFIVLGKRGNHADFAKGHLGSNLERVLRISRKPTLVASRDYEPIESAVIAFDGGPSVMRAIEFVAESTLLKNIPLHLVRVGAPQPELDDTMAAAESMLKAAGHQTSMETLPGNPDAVLPEFMEANHARLLIMGAFGHNRIRHLILGSTTTLLIRQARAPVLVVH